MFSLSLWGLSFTAPKRGIYRISCRPVSQKCSRHLRTPALNLYVPFTAGLARLRHKMLLDLHCQSKALAKLEIGGQLTISVAGCDALRARLAAKQALWPEQRLHFSFSVEVGGGICFTLFLSLFFFSVFVVGANKDPCNSGRANRGSKDNSHSLQASSGSEPQCCCLIPAQPNSMPVSAACMSMTPLASLSSHAADKVRPSCRIVCHLVVLQCGFMPVASGSLAALASSTAVWVGGDVWAGPE